jgi:hypothetical protein
MSAFKQSIVTHTTLKTAPDAGGSPVPAAVLSRVAGAPLGSVEAARVWERAHRRRGSFLVLVVGTLALLAVITIIYVALGNQDNRTRGAVKRRAELDDAPAKMSEYIAQVIANDAVSLTAEGPLTGSDTTIRVRREAMDAPGVRPGAVSDALRAGVSARLAFNPEGTLSPSDDRSIDTTTGVNDVTASDPFLASSEPVDLDGLASDATRPYLDNNSWMAISNVAPDGNYVNLYNLRPSWATGVPTTGFNASAEELRGLVDPSRGKWLLDDTGAIQTTDWGDVVNTVDAQNTPFYWTMRQQFALLPDAIGDGEPDAQTWQNPAFRKYSWVDADGDGLMDSRIFEMKRADGSTGVTRYLDALALPSNYRYFFGVRVVDLSGRINVNTAGDLLTGPGTSRTVAGNDDIGPFYRVGSSSMDVDLARVLRQTDMISDGVVSGGNFSLANLGGAYTTYDRDGAYRVGSAAYYTLRMAVATGRVPEPASDDGAIAHAFDGQAIMPGDTANPDGLHAYWQRYLPGPNDRFSWQLGNYRIMSNYGYAPQTNYAFDTQRIAIAERQARRLAEADASFQTVGMVGSLVSGFPMDDLAELLEREGVNNDSVTSNLERVLMNRERDADFAGLSPLRSDRSTDAEMGPRRGRYLLEGAAPDLTTGSLALGSDRDLAQLLTTYDVRRQLTTHSGARQIRSSILVGEFETALEGLPAYTEGQTSPTSATTRNWRNVTTTGTPDGPLGPQTTSEVSATELSPDELKVNLRSVLAIGQRDDQRRQSLRRIYRAYADALAPYSFLDEAWPPSAATQPLDLSGAAAPYRTLFYGYNGPESALLTAAHMTVNLWDMTDSDFRALLPGTPTGTPDLPLPLRPEPARATVALSQEAQQALNTGSAALQSRFPFWREQDAPATPANPPSASDLDQFALPPNVRLTLERDRLAPENARTVAPAVNIYGIEPQPFLTQVLTMTAYMDNRESGFLDTGGRVNENEKMAIKGLIPAPGTPYGGAGDNEDLLFRVVAFTITNPFDTKIELSKNFLADGLATGGQNRVERFTGATTGDPGQYVSVGALDAAEVRVDTARDYYYLQWGDKQYMLMQLQPGEQDENAGEQVANGVPAEAVDGAGPEPKYIATTPAQRIQRATLKGITMEPGQSIVCYAMSHAPEEVLLRLKDAQAFSSLPGSDHERRVDVFQEMLEHQLLREVVASATTTPSLPNDPVAYMIPLMGNASNGGPTKDGKALYPGTESYDPIPRLNASVVAPGTVSSQDAIENSPGAGETVNLWRAVRAGNPVGASAAELGEFERGDTFAVSATSYFSATVTPWTGSLVVLKPNDTSNDQLVDRLRLPWSEGAHGTSPIDPHAGLTRMDLKLPNDDETEIADTTLPVAGGSEDEGNRYSATLWAYATRRNDPRDQRAATAAQNQLPLDVIPAYCIEPKYFQNGATQTPWNITKQSTNFSNDFAGGSLDKTNFDDSSSVQLGKGISTQNAPSWLDAMQNDSNTETMYDALDVRKRPNYRGEFIDTDNEVADRRVDEPAAAPVNFRNSTFNAATAASVTSLQRSYDQMYPQLSSNARSDGSASTTSFLKAMRVADALLPMGIGPMEMPFTSAGWPSTELSKSDLVQFRQRHTTLSEALAIAMGYEEQNAIVGGTGAGARLDPALWYSAAATAQTPNTTGQPEHQSMFDRGNLHLDRYAPFVDFTVTGVNGRVFNPGDDQRRGLGIPPALAVLEQFVATPTTADASSAPGEQPLGLSLTRSVQGLVNVNTATRTVLRSLPLLSPADVTNTFPLNAPYGTGVANQIRQDEQWMAVGGRRLPENAATLGAPSIGKVVSGPGGQVGAQDVAATIDAYRFKYNVGLRPYTAAEIAASPYQALGLSTTSGDYRTTAIFQDANPTITDDAADAFDRGTFSAIPAIREEWGIASIGELYAARQRDAGALGLSDADRQALWSLPTSMDFLGNDAVDGGGAVVDVAAAPIDTRVVQVGAGSAGKRSTTLSLSTFPVPRGDLTDPASPNPTTYAANSYAEKLLQLNAVAGITTTRSDVYAVWFVVMGFQPSDIDSIQSPRDPLVPSLQRRFLMVVDRSNVTKRDQKPRILLLKEVPM